MTANTGARRRPDGSPYTIVRGSARQNRLHHRRGFRHRRLSHGRFCRTGRQGRVRFADRACGETPCAKASSARPATAFSSALRHPRYRRAAALRVADIQQLRRHRCAHQQRRARRPARSAKSDARQIGTIRSTRICGRIISPRNPWCRDARGGRRKHHQCRLEFSANLGLAGYPIYVTAKAGIVGLTRALARELGPSNIRVNALIPGWVMTRRAERTLWVTPESLAQCLAEQSLKAGDRGRRRCRRSTFSRICTRAHDHRTIADRRWRSSDDLSQVTPGRGLTG
jgi:NAD(P)-dependent dehydrogenase (short-subunit alcohol dehydrogenase family)